MFHLFKRKKRSGHRDGGNRPAKSFVVNGGSTAIEVGVWDSGNHKSIGEKYRFKISRSENGRRYSALKALDVMLLPSVALKLAQVFFDSAEDTEAKKTLGHFIALLQDYENVRKASMGQAIVNGAIESDCGQFGC